MTQSSSLYLGDEEFLTAFERAGFDRHDFPHRAHLRMAWLYVRRLGLEGAVDRVTAGIRSLAEHHGQAARYHDTLTRAWVYAVAAADRPDISTFDQFIDAHPELLDKNYLLRHYSAERLSSPEARAHWLSPDLAPIPGAPDSPAIAAGEDAPVAVLPADEFRRAMERVPLPVAVMTAHDATRVHGITVSSMATVSRNPAMLVVSVRHDSAILPVVRAAGGFGISYLGTDQRSIAARFADRKRGEDAVQFGGVPHVLGPFGAPVVTGGPVWFECRLDHEATIGERQILCGIVVAAGTTDARPLQQVQGTWV